MDEKFN